MSRISNYYDPDFIQDKVESGNHRFAIGGHWDEIGPKQLKVLIESGLKPEHKLLDIGCGCLRLGTLAIPYLEPGHYWGTDLNAALLDAGYENEVEDRSRLPRTNLVEDGDFSFPEIPEDIDYAIAFSVFTHLPFPYLRRCLVRINQNFPNLSAFLFTCFFAPDVESSLEPCLQLKNCVTYDIKDPFHYLRQDIRYLANQTGYSVEFKNVQHPRNQQVCILRPST